MWNIYKKELIVDILTPLYPVCILSVILLKLTVGNKKKENSLECFVKIDEMFQKLK